MQLDFSFNEVKKKNRTRLYAHSNHCSFAGYIPKEIITNSWTVSIKRPAGDLNIIFIGCYELQGTEEFLIRNRRSNHFTLNIYSNYYQEGQIRQVKFLIKNNKVL
jgi:hypothetical protein